VLTYISWARTYLVGSVVIDLAVLSFLGLRLLSTNTLDQPVASAMARNDWCDFTMTIAY
jgi:hypothetical protein